MEQRVQIVTDSAADMPQALVEKYGITVVPLHVTLGDESFLDGERSSRELLETMRTTRQLSSTSQPSPGQFLEAFEALQDQGPILCITISSALSGTLQSAQMAANMVSGSITLFDSMVASAGEAVQVLMAAEMAAEGHTVEEIVAKLTPYRDNLKVYQVFLTVENLVKGGRLPAWRGRLAEIMNIKLLAVNKDGAVEVLEKIRGEDAVFRRLVELTSQEVPAIEERIVVIAHADNLERAEWLKEQVRAFNPREIIIIDMGAVITTHAGPGAVIISV